MQESTLCNWLPMVWMTEILATSSIRRFTISSYSGSLPPTVSLADPSAFNAVTSTSIIPLSARSEDPDGLLERVSYYSDGSLISTIDRIQGVPEASQSYPLLYDVNSTLSDGEDSGVRSLFAIAVDNSGNYVATTVYNVSFTKGSADRPKVTINSGLMGFNVDPADVSITTAGGKIDTIQLTNLTLGNGLLEAKVLISSSDNDALGAEFTPKIQTDPQLDNYGTIVGFNKVSGGSGYEDGNISLKIVPVIRAVNQGEVAQLEYILNEPSEANATTRIAEITSAVNPDGSLQLGSGYVISPLLRQQPSGRRVQGNNRIPLAETDFPTSSVTPVNVTAVKAIDTEDNAAELIGGFTQSPIFISVEANSSGEKIESVSLVIDGETSEELILTQPSYENIYNFAWVPDEAKDYSVFATVRDVAGNVISTEESLFSVEDYKGAGVNLSIDGESNYSIEANGQLLLSADATSQYQMAEVEFYLDNISVGVVLDQGGSSFSKHCRFVGRKV